MESCGAPAVESARTSETTPSGRFNASASSAIPSKTRGALYSIAFAALAAAFSVPGCSRAPAQPSVVLIVTEGVRADRTSLYGYNRQTSPRLASLAPEGAVFDQAYASSPDDAAALASLLTGRYPPEHGLLLNRRLRDTVVTLAEALRDAGYATHAVTSETQMTKESGLQQGFDEVEMVDPAESEEMDGGAAAVSRRALGWLQGKRDPKRPFLLMAIYSSPTLPFHPPDNFRFKFVDPIVNRDRVEIVSEYWFPFADKYNAHQADLSDREMDMLHDLYDAEILYVDDQIGSVVAGLRSMKLLDQTLLVETSTRGEDLGERHRLADASSLREANLHVPLLLRLPGSVPAGQRVSGLAQDVDLMPTILDVLRLKRPETIGRSALSLAPFQGTTTRQSAVSSALAPVPGGAVDLLLSVRDDRYRLLVGPDGPRGLYDLKSDPDGSMDVLAKSDGPVGRLKKALGDWDASLQSVPGAPPLPGPNQPPPGVAVAPGQGAPAAPGGVKTTQPPRAPGKRP